MHGRWGWGRCMGGGAGYTGNWCMGGVAGVSACMGGGAG